MAKMGKTRRIDESSIEDLEYILDALGELRDMAIDIQTRVRDTGIDECSNFDYVGLMDELMSDVDAQSEEYEAKLSALYSDEEREMDRQYWEDKL